MFSALGRALQDALAPAQRRVLLLSLLIALAVFAAIWLGVGLLLHETHLTGFWLYDGAIELLGNLAVAFLTWLLFPAVATLVMGFFLDGALAEVERRRYPDLGPPRALPVAQILASGLRLAGLSIFVNLLALPLYLLIPGINLFLFYGLNGYLLGREYFEMVALRRLDGMAARAVWRRDRARFLMAGAAIAVLFSIPVVNLAAPLVAAMLMLHLFEERRSARSDGHDGLRPLRGREPFVL